jgi:hypothetical protein
MASALGEEYGRNPLALAADLGVQLRADQRLRPHVTCYQIHPGGHALLFSARLTMGEQIRTIAAFCGLVAVGLSAPLAVHFTPDPLGLLFADLFLGLATAVTWWKRAERRTA